MITISGRVPRIIIVDDNRTNQAILKLTVETAGYHAFVFSSGDDVLDAFCGPDHYDAALVDIYMPEMSGTETIQHLRMLHLASGHARDEPFPIIAMTVDERDAVREEALLAGADAFFTRPWNAAELLETLANLLVRREVVQDANTTVVDLRGHPGFRSQGQTSINVAVLEDLWSLGGEALINELAKTWASDADVALLYMQSMAERGDMVGFESRFMSILSSGSGVGATGLKPIRYLLHKLEDQSPQAIASVVIPRLRREAELVNRALASFVELKLAS
jgi:two-component system sensor histidine kinase RpfC